MGEQYLQDLYGWISSEDPTFKDRYSYNDFAFKMQNDEGYVNSMYKWIGSVDNTFYSRYTPNQFQAKVEGSETVTETVTETVVEEPKKKGFFESLGQQAGAEGIATVSASTSEEQPSSSDSQQTPEDVQRQLDSKLTSLGITPQQQQADDAFVPTPEGVATQDVGTAITSPIQKPSEDVGGTSVFGRIVEESEKAVDVSQYVRNQEIAKEIAGLNPADSKVREIRPVARNNQDGTTSTVKMMYAEVDGKHVAFPSLFPKSTNFADMVANPEEWIELDGMEAYAEAVRRGEVFTFDTEEEAKKFAEGSWKDAAIDEDQTFEVETIETKTDTRYDFDKQEFVDETEKTYVSFPSGMTADEAREQGKLMEFSTEEQAKYFADRGWKEEDSFVGTILGEAPTGGLSEVDRRLSTITSQLVKREESFVVPQMKYLFGDLGFKFKETNSLTEGFDAMRVTAPNGEELVIDLDPSAGVVSLFSSTKGRNNIASNEARKLRNFIRMNQTEESKRLFEASMQREEQRLKIGFDKEIDDAIALMNSENQEFQKKKESFFDFQNTVNRLGARFEGIDIRDLNRDPALKAEYQEYEKQLSELERQRKEILAQENLLESKGNRLDALAGAYHMMKGEQGTFAGKFYNQILRGGGDILSGLDWITSYAGIEMLNLQFLLDPEGSKQDMIKYSMIQLQNNPDKFYLGEKLRFDDNEDGRRAEEIIRSKKISDEDAEFLSSYLGKKRFGDVKQILNTIKIEGTAPKVGEYLPFKLPDFITRIDADERVDIGLGDDATQVLKDAERKYYRQYFETDDRDEALDRYFRTGSMRREQNPFSAVANMDVSSGSSERFSSYFTDVMGLGSKNVTQEAIDKSTSRDANIFERSILGMARSIPAFIGGGAVVRHVKSFAFAADHLDTQMAENPEFDNISEREKAALVVPYAAAVAVLEQYGFRNMLAGKSVLNNVVFRALKKTPKNAPAKTFTQFVRQDIESGIARGALVATAGAAAEFETGFLQMGMEIGLKNVYNEIKDKEMFDVATSGGEILGEMFIAGVEEAIGGFVMSVPNGMVVAASNQEIASVSDEQFKVFEEMTTDDKYMEMYEAKLKQQVADGKMTKEDAAAQLQDYKMIQQASRRIPVDYTIEQKKEALALEIEKQRIESKIKDKDSSLTKKQQGRINDINRQLEAIGTKAFEQKESQKKMEDAIPDISTQGKTQEKTEDDVTQEEKEDIEAFFEEETEQEAPKNNLFINKKGNRQSPMTTQQESTRGRVVEIATKAAKAINELLPQTNIILYDTTAEFQKATQRDGRGFFESGGDIHINLEKATATTVPHEVFHAVLYDKFRTDEAIGKAASNMIVSVRKAIPSNSQLAKRIDEFAAAYAKEGATIEIQNEEQLAELFGIMSSEYVALKPKSKNVVLNFIKDMAAKFGIDLGPKFGQNDTDVINLMALMSRKVKRGEAIVAEDISVLEDTDNGTTPIQTPTPIVKPSRPKGRQSIDFKENYKNSLIKPENSIDIYGLVNEIADKKQKVWFWVADQLGYNEEIGIDAGPSFALRNPKDIWSSSMPIKALENNVSKADYIFIISGSPQRSHLFNKTVFDQVVNPLGSFESFKQKVLALEKAPPKVIVDILNQYESFDAIRNAEDGKVRKSFLIAHVDQSNKNTPYAKLIRDNGGFTDTNALRDGFYAENDFKQNDIMLVLKPTRAREGSEHSTYSNTIEGEVIGVPNQKLDAFEIMPADMRENVLRKAEDKGKPSTRVQQSQVIAPYGSGIRTIEQVPALEQEYTKTGRRQVGEFQTESTMDEFGDINESLQDEAYTLASERGIGILRGKDVSNVAKDANGKVVGATFTEYNNANGIYSFDIVVDESVEGQGVGTMLLEDAMYPPYEIQEINPDVKTRVEVVNPVMQVMLENRGFRVTKKLGPDSVIMEPAPVRGREQRSYPLEDISRWYGESNYKSTGGKLIYMTPKQFLGLAKPLKMDEETRENVDDLKAHIEDGKRLDPLTLYGTDRTNVRDSDGRHRAIASMELGIQEVPVVDFTGQTIGREQIDIKDATQKYSDDYVVDVIKKARDAKFRDSVIEYFVVERLKMPLKKARDMMSIKLNLYDTLPRSFANMKGGKKTGIKLWNKVEAYRRKLVENNKRRTKLTEAQIKAEIKKFKSKLNEGRKLTENEINKQVEAFRENITKLTQEQIQKKVDELRTKLQEKSKKDIDKKMKGVLFRGLKKDAKRQKRAELEADAEADINKLTAAYEFQLNEANARRNDLTPKQIEKKVTTFKNNLEKANKKKQDRLTNEQKKKRTEKFEQALRKKNDRRKPKLTEQEIMDETISYMEQQPEYKAEAEFIKKDGKLTAKKGFSTQQAAMIVELQKEVGIRPSENIFSKISKVRKARAILKSRKEAAKDIQKVKTTLRNFLRQSLPASIYTKGEVISLINKINKANKDNIEAISIEVENFVIEKSIQDVQARIKKILGGKYTVRKGGKVKGKGVSAEIMERLNFIKDNVITQRHQNDLEKMEAYEAKQEELEKRKENLDTLITIEMSEQQLAELADVIMAINLNEAYQIDTKVESLTDIDASAHKLEILEEAAENLEGLVSKGKSELQNEIKANKKRRNDLFTRAYEDITRTRIDFNAENSKAQLEQNKRNLKRRYDGKNLSKGKSIVRTILRSIEANFILTQEALDGLMDKLSKMPGEMFGGNLQEIVTQRIDDATIVFKGRMMEQQQIVEEAMKMFYGKNYKAKAREYNTVYETNIKDQDGYNMNLSQNQMYYLYNQYKDENNHPAFASKFGREVINENDSKETKETKRKANEQTAKRIMTQIENELKPDVKAFADWQVNTYFPSLYNYYNQVYRRLFYTNMPYNKEYAGRLFRADVDIEPIDILSGTPSFSASVSHSSAKSRTDSNKPILITDGNNALYGYLNEMEYFAAYAEAIRDVDGIFKNSYIKDAIRQINGNQTYNIVDDTIKVIANRGRQRGQIDFIMNGIMSAYVLGKIAINPLITVKQLTSLFVYANDIGYRNWIKYGTISIPQFRQTVKEIRENSVYVKDRTNESFFRVIDAHSTKDTDVIKDMFPPAYVEGLNTITRIAMSNSRFGDITAILWGGTPNYLYYKNEALRQGKTEEQAIEIAIKKFERDTKRAQQSTDIQDKDYFQSLGGFARPFNVFQTSQKQYLRQEIKAIRSLRRKANQALRGDDALSAGKGKVSDAARTILTYHVLAPTMFAFVAGGFPGILRDWREDDGRDFFYTALFGNLLATFLTGEMFSTYKDYLTDKPYAAQESRTVPLTTSVRRIIENQIKIDNAKKEETKQKYTDKRNKELFEIFGIPFGTGSKLIKNYMKVFDNWVRKGKFEREDILRLLGYSDYQIEDMPAKDDKKSDSYYDGNTGTDYRIRNNQANDLGGPSATGGPGGSGGGPSATGGPS